MTLDGGIITVADSAPASSTAPAAPRIEVVLNWFEELKRLAPSANGRQGVDGK